MQTSINGIALADYVRVADHAWYEIRDIRLEDDDYYMVFDLFHGWSSQPQVQLVMETQPDCCAHHYWTIDDDLSYYIGSKIEEIELVSQPDVYDDGECHEVSFLKITTSKGTFTAAAHNVHNGYYGGISLTTSIRRPEK